MVQVLAPRAGPTGLIASLWKWGVQLIDVVSGAGAITKYTVGPAWTGAEFQTIQAAVDQAVIDGHSVAFPGVRFLIYPGFYGETVVVPETLVHFHFVGAGQDAGTFVTGFNLALPDGVGDWSFAGIGMTTLTVNEAVSGSGAISARFADTWIYGAVNITAPDLRISASSSYLVGSSARTISVSRFEWFGGRIGLSSSAATLTLTTATDLGRLYNVIIFGRLSVGGLGFIMFGCTHSHGGSPAVTSACTSATFAQGNIFTHNSGPAGPVWIETSTALFHPGGNVFTEGQLYPWYQLGVGGKSAGAESDVELRNVLHVSGSPTLTPAQVGGQRKTTVAKDDSGGSVTLPAIASVEPGCTIVLKDVSGNATAAPWTVVPDGAETIDGAASYSISTNFASVEVQVDPDAVVWMVIGSYL